MNNAFGLKENDLEEIISILREHKEVEEALVFGSRAKGNHKNGSDVDIALKGKITFEIVSHISFLLNEETAMPYRFDVLNYNTIRNKELTEHIDRTGISFYQRSKSFAKITTE